VYDADPERVAVGVCVLYLADALSRALAVVR